MKVDVASIRTEISPSDLDELAIPGGRQSYLKKSFNSMMHYTTDINTAIDYQNESTLMENFLKKPNK